MHTSRRSGQARAGAHGHRGNRRRKKSRRRVPVGQLVAERQHGVVKWFSSKMGYGFIGRKKKKKGAEDIFVHYSSVLGEGFKSLFKGNRVAFDIESTNKGLEAKNVRVVN